MRRVLLGVGVWVVSVLLAPVAAVIWVAVILVELWYEVRAWRRA